jgi:hypothetical protein
MMKLAVLLTLALLLAACPMPLPRRDPDVPTGPWYPFATDSGPRVLQHEPDMQVSMTVPALVPYKAAVFGVSGQLVSVKLTNTSKELRSFEGLRLSFAAMRNGVTFPCLLRPNSSASAPTSREPTSLPPQGTFYFERAFECTLPLPGQYTVHAYVALRPQNSQGDFAGSFLVTVGDSQFAPRPYRVKPGLYVAMTGANIVAPMPEDAWARGDYHAVVALVNGSKDPIELGPGSMAFRTYRNNSKLPCAGQKARLALPETLAPGSLHIVYVPLACAPSLEGRYEIIGRFALDTNSETVEVGHFALDVTSDPRRFSPAPW